MFKNTALFFLTAPFFIFSEAPDNPPTAVFEHPTYVPTPIQAQAVPSTIEPVEYGKPKSPFVVMAPVTNKIAYDIDWSPYAGGEDILFAHKVLEKLDTYILASTPMSYAKTAYARFWRLSELITIWLPINYLAMVVQHEVFGHGYRVRDLYEHQLARVESYSFNAPPPYGPGGAATSYAISPRISTSEESAIAIGGVEATAILAQLTKLKWLESARIDPRQSVLYLLSQQDLTLYIDASDGETEGDDISGYIKTLNYTYPDSLLTKQQLQNLSWINLADPFTFYAIFSWFHYLSSGKETKIPMIASMYLPSFRLGLTPFGPEVFFENYFRQSNKPLYAYIKAGRHANNDYFGAGVYSAKLWSVWKWSFGLRADIWRQPKLLLQPGATPFFDIDFEQPPSVSSPLYSSSQRHAVRWGGAASVISTYQGSESCGYEMEFGYKSKGFLPGYSLWAFPTVRLAITLNF